mmetsp:Transcript_117008/g.331121  ORF Transcript_117008/g.331121 Transcript_117008/m.331121 type:complete len:183 (-) Transcript_117008:8-556(-)
MLSWTWTMFLLCRTWPHGFLELDNDDEQYSRFFAWRSRFRVETELETSGRAYCELCKELHEEAGEAESGQAGSRVRVPSKNADDFMRWFTGAACRAQLPSWASPGNVLGAWSSGDPAGSVGAPGVAAVASSSIPWLVAITFGLTFVFVMLAAALLSAWRLHRSRGVAYGPLPAYEPLQRSGA